MGRGGKGTWGKRVLAVQPIHYSGGAVLVGLSRADLFPEGSVES